MFADRHVRLIRLKAQNQEQVGRVANQLEDAMRTASLPGIPKNGLVIIRRLDLGQLKETSNATTLSSLLDAKSKSMPNSHFHRQGRTTNCRCGLVQRRN